MSYGLLQKLTILPLLEAMQLCCPWEVPPRKSKDGEDRVEGHEIKMQCNESERH